MSQRRRQHRRYRYRNGGALAPASSSRGSPSDCMRALRARTLIGQGLVTISKENPPPLPKANPIPSSPPPPPTHQPQSRDLAQWRKTINGLNLETGDRLDPAEIRRQAIEQAFPNVDIEGMENLCKQTMDANLHEAPPPKPPAPPPPTEVKESPPPRAAPPPFSNTDTTNTWQGSDTTNSCQTHDTQAYSQDNPSQSTVGSDILMVNVGASPPQSR